MMKYEDVMALIKEFDAESKKTRTVERPTKRGGFNYEIVYTPRYKELFHDKDRIGLRSRGAEIFQCGCCGRYHGFFELEIWCCDFDTKKFICSECYEDEMGADL